ncbi:putative metal-binding motif-containing protein [Myxococcota bacterium]|nr:putative metal-binding motif-containing protein [Myxococcota bacterium]
MNRAALAAALLAALAAAGCNQTTVVDAPDSPPVISIVFPADEAEFAEGEVVTFQARLTDDRDLAATEISWSSSLVPEPLDTAPSDADGVIEFTTVGLPPGLNLVTVHAVDEAGGSSQDSVAVAIRALEELDADRDGFAANAGDCDDADPSIYPGAPEQANGVDDDCDGTIDEGTVLYDDDGDGTTELEGDCDDGDAATGPGAPEACDGADNDCDGIVDEDTPCSDDDGDGSSENGGDCDDGDPSAYPGGSEVADGVDNDCDGHVDEDTCAADYDGDGYCPGREVDPSCPVETCLDGSVPGDCDDGDPFVSPSGVETCNGTDDDCDGTTDEEGADSCFEYYEDKDGDGFGVGSPRCLCAFEGDFHAFQGGDCYDFNGDAHPGQLAYFNAHRGDGSWDYDCDGGEGLELADRYDGECGFFEGGDVWGCAVVGQGWRDGVPPDCGDSADWIDSCHGCDLFDWSCACGIYCCDYSGPTRTQACR